MFPEYSPPMVIFLFKVVESVPSPVKYVAPVVPAMLAVGTPRFTPVNANLAEAVVVPPKRTSTVEVLG